MQEYEQAEYDRALPIVAQVILDGRDHPVLTQAEFSQYVKDLNGLIPDNLKKEVVYFADSKNLAGLDAYEFFRCFDIYFNEAHKLVYSPESLSKNFRSYFGTYSEDITTLSVDVRLQKNIRAYEASLAEAKRVYSEGLGLEQSERQLANWNWDEIEPHHLMVSSQIDAVMGYVLAEKRPEMRAHYHPSVVLPESSNQMLKGSYRNGLLFTRNFPRPTYISVNPGGHWTQLVVDEDDKVHYADSLSGGAQKKAALAKRLKSVFPDFSCTEDDIVCTGEQTTDWPCGYYVIRKNLMDMGVTDHPIVEAKTEEQMRDAVFEVIAQITGKPCPARLKEPSGAKVNLGVQPQKKAEKPNKWTDAQIKQIKEKFAEIFEHEDDEAKRVKNAVLKDHTVKTTDLDSHNLEQFVIKALAFKAELIKAGVIKEGPVVIDAPTPEKLQELIKLCEKHNLEFVTESKEKQKRPDKIQEPAEDNGPKQTTAPSTPRGAKSGAGSEDEGKAPSASPGLGKKPNSGAE